MRFIYPLLMFIALGVVLVVFYTDNVKADPKLTAQKFMKAIRAGKYQEAVDQFGGNACRCPAKGGWVSYLVYSSSQEPNLGFLTGKNFNYKIGNTKPIEPSEEAKKGTVPWQSPEDVVIDVDIEFDQSVYVPLFLPVKMAYGKDITEAELDQFLSNPDKEAWKGFTLRLRPSLNKGAIDRPEASKGIKYRPTEPLKDTDKKKAKSEEDENYVYAPLEDMIKETLGEEGVMYLHPRDPGAVITGEKEKLSLQEVSNKLPRLTKAKMRLHIVRRGQLKEWTVYHVAINDPILTNSDGSKIELKNYRPRYDNDSWNPRNKKRPSIKYRN